VQSSRDDVMVSVKVHPVELVSKNEVSYVAKPGTGGTAGDFVDDVPSVESLH
jgi:hypothetical protein